MASEHGTLSKEDLLDGLPPVLSSEDRDLIYENYVSGEHKSLYVDWVEGEKILLLGSDEDYQTTATMFDYNERPLAGLTAEEIAEDFGVTVQVYDRVEDSAGGPPYYPIWMSGTSNNIIRLQLRLRKSWPEETKGRS